jgi:hypothetical protein
MQKWNVSITILILVLAGCTVPEQNNDEIYMIGNVPEAVAAIAAPRQDLTTARLRREDNCYWYMHSGPVETTLVPLRATGGRPICISLRTS